jgi:hypothetical protein
MTFPGASTEYANRINAREFKHLQTLYPTLGSVITSPCFLTELRWFAQPSDLNDDLVLTRAPDDSEYRNIYYAGVPVPESLFAILALTGYGAWSCRRRRKRSS